MKCCYLIKLSKDVSKKSKAENKPGGGYSQKIWVGVCGPFPKTLTLFITKICDFPYPIYDLTKTLYPIYDLTLLVAGFMKRA